MIFASTMISAQEGYQQFKSNFDDPFRNLTLDNFWILDDLDEKSVSFEHLNDEDVTFTIHVGKALDENISIEKLYRQIKAANGKVNDIPLLFKSFPLVILLLELLEMDIQFEKYQRTTINQLASITGYIMNEDDYELFYLFVVNNRIYNFSFTSPVSKFADYEPYFNATLRGLFN